MDRAFRSPQDGSLPLAGPVEHIRAVDAMPDGAERSSRERLQRAVGRDYAVGRLLGRGGFAEVFEAEEPRLSRRVAIKALRPDLGASHDLLARFQREARAMAGLRHPNVMEIYTVGESEGVAFFVMPLVDGESLKGLIAREGALPLDDAIRILVEAAGALEAAHRAGTVHRDVKPDNILLEGDAARVLITDFGIAKALVGDTGSNTTSGTIMGTPQYMSPEQATGEESDHRSDIYSLGVVAFEMVTGKPPFEARTVQALIAKHLTEVAPPLRSLRPDCPQRVARVVARCLAKDPGARWLSLAEVVEALEGEDDSVGADALESSMAAAVLAPVRRFQRTVLTAVGGLVVLGLADLVFGLGGASAWVAAGVSGYLAARAAKLWREGYEWRDLALGPVAGGQQRLGSAMASSSGAQDEDYGRFSTLIRSLVSDRATILKAYSVVTRQEQGRLRDLQPTVDGLAVRAKHLARRVVNLESRIAEAASRMERSPSDDSVDVVGDGAGVRHTARLNELSSARDDAAGELRACIGRLEEIRERLSGEEPTESAGPTDELARMISAAATYLSQRAI